MKTDLQPTVVVFCDHLLYPSETFIRAQGQALRRFSPVYAGSRRVRGLELPAERTCTISAGSAAGLVREALFKLFGTAPNLVRKLGALDPVLMHAHFGPDGLRALPLARRLDLPLIVTFHGSDATATDIRYNKAPYGFRRYLVKRAVLQQGTELFIAVSHFIREKLLEQRFPPERVLVHFIGIDTTFFCPAGGAEESVVLFVGRLVERKGAAYLIRAMAEVQKANPGAELVVIGDGPLRANLEKQAKDSLRKYRFLGVQNPEMVREWMNHASVFSVPSLKTRSGEEEAFGMVFAEAQAMQKPVVAFTSGGVGEAVQHGETGFLAPERDWRTLAEYLSLFLNNPDLRHKFGVLGRQRVLRFFDLDKQTDILEKHYERTIEVYRSKGMSPSYRFVEQEN
jgi:colanic acid/amylovoran biosynthesis glycosyltransferase